MKQFFTLLLLTACVHYSCSNDNKVSAATTEPAVSADDVKAKDEDALKKAREEKEKKMDALKKLNPYTPDQLKNSLPKELDGMKQRGIDGHSALGYAQASCEYKKDSITIAITLSDCAGEVGATQYGLNYWSKLNVPEQSGNGYTKTIDFKGGKAVESFDQSAKQTTLTYLSGDRLLVMATGKNISAEELKAKMQKLTLKM